jgi:hypothetical protein
VLGKNITAPRFLLQRIDVNLCAFCMQPEVPLLRSRHCIAMAHCSNQLGKIRLLSY